jgi:hypothetical protein
VRESDGKKTRFRVDAVDNSKNLPASAAFLQSLRIATAPEAIPIHELPALSAAARRRIAT